MRIRTMKDLAAAIRSRRKTLGLDQAALATAVGVSREWVIDIEKGKPRVEAALVLRTLSALGLTVNLTAETGEKPHAREGRKTVTIKTGPPPPEVSIDAIVDLTRRKE